MSRLSDYQFITNMTTNYTQRRQTNCNCGLTAILKEVKSDTPNKGRYFLSCRRYGGPNHSEKCNFFKWWNNPILEQDNDEETELLLHDNNNIIDVNEVNTYPAQVSNIVPRSDSQTTVFHQRDQINLRSRSSNRNNTSSTTLETLPRSQSPSPSNTANLANGTPNTTTVIRNGNDDPLIYDNWNNVPKYTSLQLLDIVKNHILKQEVNNIRWRSAVRKNELNEMRTDMDKLRKDLEYARELCDREKSISTREKRQLEKENDDLKKVVNDLKNENNNLKNENSNSKNENNNLKNENNDLKNENEVLKKRRY